MGTRELQQTIEDAWQRRAELSASTVDEATRTAIDAAIDGLDRGEYRVAEPLEGRWCVHAWLKQAVLLYFRIHDNAVLDAGYARFSTKSRSNTRTAMRPSSRVRACA